MIPQLLVLLVVIAMWQVADTVVGWDRVVIPNPLEVAAAFRENWRQLVGNTLVTVSEAVSGFAVGAAMGAAIAGLVVLVPSVRELVISYAVIIKAVPIVVLAPLLVMWFGDGLVSKVVMAATAAFFPILINCVAALTSVEQEWCDLLRLHGATEVQVFWMLRVPHAMPEFFAGMKVATSLSMVGAVVGEFTGSSRGLGHLITTSTYYLNTDLVFAGVIMLGTCGVVFYWVVDRLERALVFWNSER